MTAVQAERLVSALFFLVATLCLFLPAIRPESFHPFGSYYMATVAAVLGLVGLISNYHFPQKASAGLRYGIAMLAMILLVIGAYWLDPEGMRKLVQ